MSQWFDVAARAVICWAEAGRHVNGSGAAPKGRYLAAGVSLSVRLWSQDVAPSLGHLHTALMCVQVSGQSAP